MAVDALSGERADAARTNRATSVPVRASPVPSVVRNRNNTPGLELGIDRPAPSPSACLAPLTGTARSTPLLLVRRR